MVRKTGMVVYAKRFHSRVPFCGVFECRNDGGNRRLRDMEPPRHDGWDPDLPEKGNNLKTEREFTEHLRDCIRALAPVGTEKTLAIPDLSQYLPDDGDTPEDGFDGPSAAGDGRHENFDRSPKAQAIPGRPIGRKPPTRPGVASAGEGDEGAGGDGDGDEGGHRTEGVEATGGARAGATTPARPAGNRAAPPWRRAAGPSRGTPDRGCTPWSSTRPGRVRPGRSTFPSRPSATTPCPRRFGSRRPGWRVTVAWASRRKRGGWGRWRSRGPGRCASRSRWPSRAGWRWMSPRLRCPPMKLSSRSFPHPVVGNADDVPGAEFQATLEFRSDKTNFYLKATVRCSSRTLNRMVAKGTACHTLHVECGNTLYRRTFDFAEADCEVPIPVAQLHGDVEVNAFVRAKAAVSDYAVEGAHEDYGEATFPVAPGDILAVGDGQVFDADHSVDALRRVGALMEVEQSPLPGEQPMEADFGQDKIVILLSEPDFALYRVLKTHTDLNGHLTTTLVLPVLIEALHRLDDREDDAGRFKWARLLRQRIDALPDDARSDALKTAQALLVRPIHRALTTAKVYADRTAE